MASVLLSVLCFPVQTANEGFFLKWFVQTLRFLIDFFLVQYIGVSQTGAAKDFSPVRFRGENKFFQRLER